MLSVSRPLSTRCARYQSCRATPSVAFSATTRPASPAALRPSLSTTAAEGVGVQWNDIVEYVLPRPLAGATLGLGRVEEVTDTGVTLAPLEQEDEESWVESHDAAPAELPASSVLRVLDCEFSQRQDRDGNPHGEHAHDVYRLLMPPSADVYRGRHAPKVVLRDASDS